MANERERDQDESTMGENLGGARGDRQEESPSERIGGKSEENLRGVADEGPDDEFEDTDDLDEEEEDEADGTV